VTIWPHEEPECAELRSPSVELVIAARAREIGAGLSVRRLLPVRERRLVGPFILVDHMGPITLAPGHGLDVLPHPHIGLATVTYLFDGELLHRDSIGNAQPIQPGALNWMTAGRGIVHSERTPGFSRERGSTMHGMQLWVALPRAFEEVDPSFQHHAASALPEVELPGARLRVIAGSAFGATSPVRILSPLFYVEARLEPGATLRLPDDHAGRAAYVVSGAVSVDGQPRREGTMLVMREGVPAEVQAIDGRGSAATGGGSGASEDGRTPVRPPDGPPSSIDQKAHVLLLGGAPLDGERHAWWNFVSSSRERIERAKDDWREGRFPSVPGDEVEFVPLP
jgi:redox-sensitive bicupin YhaK (pirin superfamily)